MEVIQLWSAIPVAILTIFIGPLLRGEITGRLAKKIARHADLCQKLKGNPEATSHLDLLLAKETKVLNERETCRLTRKLNGGNVATLIFVALLGGGFVYGLISVAIALAETPVWFWALMVLGVIVGIFTIALAAVGLGSLYEPRENIEKTIVDWLSPVPLFISVSLEQL